MEKILDILNQNHTGPARALLYHLGGDPVAIMTAWEERVGEQTDIMKMFGQPPLTLEDAAHEAYLEIIRQAGNLYFTRLSRADAVVIANGITDCGTLYLAQCDDLRYNDVSFADAWNHYHPDKPPIVRHHDIG
nr:MAG TPA: hypothetical protein [Caudoviricetes sp.]